jgi:hypothetical protein
MWRSLVRGIPVPTGRYLPNADMHVPIERLDRINRGEHRITHCRLLWKRD